MQKIGIIGAGAWGTALAQILSQAGRDVVLWAREPDVLDALSTKKENTFYLPGIPLHGSIQATGSLSKSVDCDALLITTPAQYVRPTLQALKGDLEGGRPVVICAKGIELQTGSLMSQVCEQEAPNATCTILSGPTFAREIARGLPSAVTIAAKDKEIGQNLKETLSTRTFRTYVTDDVLGSQIGGAVKNVVAIACGVIYGLKMGESARAALMTRGMAEMARLASAMGAKRETLMGMCGMGDLMLTASSMQSRNYSLGVQLGEGRTIEEILSSRKAVTEGVHTAKALTVMAARHAVDMPISSAVNACLNEGMSIEDAIERMLDRPLKSENL